MAEESGVSFYGEEHPYGLHIGDARELDEILQSNFGDNEDLVDVAITSPPYADMKNYEADEDLQIGWGQTYDDYLEELRKVYRKTYDVTKNSGTLWVVVNTFKNDSRMVRLPFDIADVCENLTGKQTCDQCESHLRDKRDSGEKICPSCGWTYDALDDSWVLQETVIWDKKRARPWSGEGRFRNVFEYILCFSKEKTGFKFDLDNIRIADPDEFKKWWVNYPERYNPRGKVPNNIWSFTTPTQGSWGSGDVDHPAPFPPEMVERIINLTTDEGDVVFDPFAGTGTVLAQADVMGRRPLGIELSDDYAEMYDALRGRIEQEWEDKVTEGETLEKKQERLEQKICKLRQLNFPRELTRRVRKELGADSLDDLGINTLFQLSHEVVDRDKFDDDHLFMEDDLYIVVDADVTDSEREAIQKAAEKCADEEPCSKFGIVANIHTIGVEQTVEQIRTSDWGSQFYVYANDCQSEPETVMALSEWRTVADNPRKWRGERAKNDYPPILSNIEVRAEHTGGQDGDKKESTGLKNASLSDFGRSNS